MPQRLVALILASLLFVSGCQEGDEPPPQFNHAMAAGGRTLLPTKVPDRSYDKSILGAAARPEDISAAGTPTTGPAGKVTIKIDDATPQGIVQTFLKIAMTQNLMLLPDILVPEQQDIVREMAEAMGPVLQAFEQLKTVWTKTFPDQPMQGAQPPGGMLPMGESALEIENIDEISDTEAEATLKAGNVPKPIKLKCKRIEDAWRIELPDMSGPEQRDQMRAQLAAVPNFAKAIQTLTDRISGGEFATAQEAGQALMQTMLQQAAQGAQPEKNAVQDKQPSTADPNPPRGRRQPSRPKKRERDEVDDVISGPTLNRSRR